MQLSKLKKLSTLATALLLVACSSNNTLNSSWMKDNQNKIAAKHLYQITIPGTHFANAYGIAPSSQVCIGETLPDSISDNAIIAAKIGTESSTLKTNFINYLNTQTNNVYGQLRNGERYLEISICTQKAIYYTSNYYLTDPFNDITNQIKEFIGENPDEIIILDFDNNLRDDYGYMSDNEINNFHNYLQMTFGSYLTPKQDWQQLTFEKLWSTKHRIILFSSNPVLKRYYDVWDKDQVFAYQMEPKYALIKKLTAIQQSLPHAAMAESSGLFSAVSAYSYFNPELNDLMQLNSLSDDHLILDYLNTLPKNTPLNIIVSDRQFNRLMVNYAVDKNSH